MGQAACWALGEKGETKAAVSLAIRERAIGSGGQTEVRYFPSHYRALGSEGEKAAL